MIMTSSNQYKILEVLEAYLYLKARIYLDQQRNNLFKFLDKHSKKLDDIADSKIKNFDMRQYAMFRDITEMRFDTRDPYFSVFGTMHDMNRPLRGHSPEEETYDYFDEEN